MEGKLGGPIFLPKYDQNTTRLCYFIAEVSISANNRGGWPQRITAILRVFHEEIRGAGKRKRNVVADYSQAHKRQSFSTFKCWRRRWNYATQYISKRGMCAECDTTSWGGCAPCICILTSHLFVTYFTLLTLRFKVTGPSVKMWSNLRLFLALANRVF